MFDVSCVHDIQNDRLTDEIWLELKGLWMKRSRAAIAIVLDEAAGVAGKQARGRTASAVTAGFIAHAIRALADETDI
ncbi:MAG: hypothetical protein V3R81_11840 [Gammaproteobacteria bacterium]